MCDVRWCSLVSVFVVVVNGRENGSVAIPHALAVRLCRRRARSILIRRLLKVVGVEGLWMDSHPCNDGVSIGSRGPKGTDG